jgi:hypothetical protein
MRKTFLVLCIVALALLGLSTLPRMTATGDSDFAIGNLSKIAEELGVVPEEDGKYSLASILEAFYVRSEKMDQLISLVVLDSIESTEKQISDLETTITQLRLIGGGPAGVSSDRLNELANWTEHELDRLWDNWNRLDRELNNLWNQINNCCR